MDSLNQILNSFSGQIADGSVSFNPDIFESNVVNITILHIMLKLSCESNHGKKHFWIFQCVTFFILIVENSL